jgi:hypothetical protein
LSQLPSAPGSCSITADHHATTRPSRARKAATDPGPFCTPLRVRRCQPGVQTEGDVRQPPHAEPSGAILALLCALFEDGLHSVRACGRLAGYRTLLHSPFCHVPYDALPGALTAGDLDDVAAALAPTPLRLERLVDGLNRPLTGRERERFVERIRAAYRAGNAEASLQVVD